MKIRRIKEKLDKLLGVTSSKEKINKKSLKNIENLVHQLEEKEVKLQERLSASEDKEERQKLKHKLKLVKKQLAKADEYKQELGSK